MPLQQVRDSDSLRMTGREKFFTCKATMMGIRSLSEGARLWFPACPTCKNEATEADDKWNCEMCSKTYEAPLYQ